MESWILRVSCFTYFARASKYSWFHEPSKNQIHFLNKSLLTGRLQHHLWQCRHLHWDSILYTCSIHTFGHWSETNSCKRKLFDEYKFRFFLSVQTCVLNLQKNDLIEMVLSAACSIHTFNNWSERNSCKFTIILNKVNYGFNAEFKG